MYIYPTAAWHILFRAYLYFTNNSVSIFSLVYIYIYNIYIYIYTLSVSVSINTLTTSFVKTVE